MMLWTKVGEPGSSGEASGSQVLQTEIQPHGVDAMRQSYLTSAAAKFRLKMSVSDIAIGGLFILVPEFVGFLASRQVRSSKGYYNAIKKPFWSPPQFLFRPIWVLLFGLMGIASYLVFRKGRNEGINVKPALTAYAVQLFFNAIWASLFFRFQSRFIALIDITIVIGTVIVTIILFEQVDDKAAQLMLPYLFWIVISGYLNKSIWRLNQGRAFIDVTKLNKKKGKVAKKVVESSEEESESAPESESESETESEAEETKAKAKKAKVETESESEESEAEEEVILKKVPKSKKGRGKFKCGNCGVELEV